MTDESSAPQPRRSLGALWVVLGSLGFLAVTAVGVIITITTAAAFGAVLGHTATSQFSADDASTVLLTQSQSEPFGTWAAPQTEYAAVSDAQSELQNSWQSDSPQPSSLPCEFAYALYPVTNLESAAEGSQPVALNDQFVSVDDRSTMSQSVRVFASSREASAYMSQLRTLIDGCTSYATATWSATVAPLTLPSVDLNTSAWVETGTGAATGGSYFAADVQRGNVVTRVTAQAGVSGTGALNQKLFESVVDVAAANLQALRPGAGAASGSVSA